MKGVEELLTSQFKVDGIYTTDAEEFSTHTERTEVHAITQKELDRISGLSTPNKVLAVARIPSDEQIDWNESLMVMLDGIRDPGNLGTIIRTARWFGAKTIVCSEDCADVWDRKVVQSTMGALFHVHVVYSDLNQIMQASKQHGFRLLGAAMNGDSIYEIPRPEKTLLLIGSESHGISEHLMQQCDQLITIPNLESDRQVESLNAAIATAIILSEITRPK